MRVTDGLMNGRVRQGRIGTRVLVVKPPLGPARATRGRPDAVGHGGSAYALLLIGACVQLVLTLRGLERR